MYMLMIELFFISFQWLENRHISYNHMINKTGLVDDAAGKYCDILYIHRSKLDELVETHGKSLVSLDISRVLRDA